MQEGLAQESLFSIFKQFASFGDPQSYTYPLDPSHFCEEPEIVKNEDIKQLQKIADTIHKVLPLCVKEWHSNTKLGKQIREIIKLPERIEKLLLNHYKNNKKELISSMTNHIGFCRPDFIIQENKKKDIFKICEINARFTVNGYLISYFLNESSRIFSNLPNSNYNKLKVSCIPQIQSLIDDILRFFFTFNEKIYFIVGLEPNLYGITILKSICKEKIIIISPNEISISKESGKLIDIRTNEEIQKCILELHQEEIFSISDDILNYLLKMSDHGNCINDLRTILIIHDKRLFSILNELQIPLQSLLMEEILIKNKIDEKESKKIIKILRNHVIPSVTKKYLLENDKNPYVWLHLSGSNEKTILFKPSFDGKGKGIQISSNFSSLQEFCNEIRDNGLNEDYFSSGIIQPLLNSKITNLKIYNHENQNYDVKSLTSVGLILCFNNKFYGPGLFRYKADKIVALSGGGFIKFPCLQLSKINSRINLPFHILTQIEEETNDNNDEILKWRKILRKKFAENGNLLITLDDRNNPNQKINENQFQNIIFHLFQGEKIINSNNNEKSDEKVQIHHVNHSNIDNNEPISFFSYKNDIIMNKNEENIEDFQIPQIISFNMKKSNNLNKFSLLNIKKDIFKHFKEDEINQLHKIIFTMKEDVNKTFPLFYGYNKIQLLNNYSNFQLFNNFNNDKQLNKLVIKLNRIIKKFTENEKNYFLLPENCILLINNQKYLHSWCLENCNHVYFNKILFNLPQKRSPKLDLCLLHHFDDLDLNNQQISHEFFGDVNYSSNKPIYCSPSGQSGVTRATSNICDGIVSTLFKENMKMRFILARQLISTGYLHSNINFLNLFTNSNLYRSGEIFNDILRACNVSVFPYFGGSFETYKVILASSEYKINAIGALGSRLTEFVQWAKQGLICLKNIKIIFFGGEPIDDSLRDIFRQYCSPDVVFFGFYGSSEAGVFAYQTPNTIEICKAFDKNNHQNFTNVYEYIDDCVHLQIENNEFGNDNLIVTNFFRKPEMIRFNSKDCVSWVDKNSNKFIKVIGRDPNARGINIGERCWFFFNDIVDSVLKPLHLQHIPCQIEFSGSAPNVDVTLVILNDSAINLSDLNLLFHQVVMDLVVTTTFRAFVRVVDTFDKLTRSLRSNKLLNFVDKRDL